MLGRSRRSPSPGGGLGRQTGSSFKAFTLAAALEKGYSPQQGVPGAAVDHDPAASSERQIGNNEGEGGGSATIQSATQHSINTVFAQMIRDVGVKDDRRDGEEARHDHRLGRPRTTVPRLQLHAWRHRHVARSTWRRPTACSRRAASGTTPTPIVKVATPTGKVLEDNRKRQGEQVIERGHRRQRHRHPPHRHRRRHRHAAPTSAGRRRARRVPARTSPTRGSSGTRRRCRPRCGWVTPTTRRRRCCNIKGVASGVRRHHPGGHVEGVHERRR